MTLHRLSFPFSLFLRRVVWVVILAGILNDGDAPAQLPSADVLLSVTESFEHLGSVLILGSFTSGCQRIWECQAHHFSVAFLLLTSFSAFAELCSNTLPSWRRSTALKVRQNLLSCLYTKQAQKLGEIFQDKNLK